MKRAIVLVLILLFIITALPRLSNASDKEGYPFELEIIFPENNIGDAGYYHIPGRPGEKITLQAKLTNLTDKPIEIISVPMNSYSGPGGIFYVSPYEVNSKIYSYSDDKYALVQYITVKEIITLQPKKSELVDIIVNVPQIESGILVGSIQFKVFDGIQKMQNSDKKSGSLILFNKYQAFNTGIMIDLPEKDKTSIIVKEPQYYFDTKNLGIKISNEAALIEENISGNYQIKDKQDNVIDEGSIAAFRMAPKTAFYYMIPWGDREFVQDVYTVYMDLNANGQPMKFEIPLESVKETVAPENENISDENENNTGNNSGIQTGSETITPQNNMRTIFIIVLAAVIIIFAILIYVSYKRSKKVKRSTSI